MYDIINNNKEVTQVSETSISFYLIWLRLKNPSVIHKKTTTEFIYIIFLFHNFFPFGYPVWMPIFNTKVCKRSCRWQVLCVKKCTKVFGCGSIMIKTNRNCFNMSWMRKANKSSFLFWIVNKERCICYARYTRG